MEIRFIAHIIDQLDFALDHIGLQDVNYKRLSLMLIDNAMELALHEHAEEEQHKRKYERDLPDAFRGAMEAAQGRHFESKVKFAKISGFLTEEMALTIGTLHSYRNQLYHRGLMHEEILHSLAMFYFHITCDAMSVLPHFGYGWSNRTQIPLRAIKYLEKLPFKNVEQTILQAWSRLKEVGSAIPYNLSKDLQEQLSTIVNETDELLDYLSKGHSEKRSRDELVKDVQAWHIAFSKKGKEFARKNPTPATTIQSYVDWYRDTYPFDVKRDPIAAWNEQVASVRDDKNEHMALKKYHEFIQRTESFREALSDSVRAFDAEVDRQIDAAREAR